jgi:hypothetical protein
MHLLYFTVLSKLDNAVLIRVPDAGMLVPDLKKMTTGKNADAGLTLSPAFFFYL